MASGGFEEIPGLQTPKSLESLWEQGATEPPWHHSAMDAQIPEDLADYFLSFRSSCIAELRAHSERLLAEAREQHRVMLDRHEILAYGQLLRGTRGSKASGVACAKAAEHAFLSEPPLEPRARHAPECEDSEQDPPGAPSTVLPRSSANGPTVHGDAKLDGWWITEKGSVVRIACDEVSHEGKPFAKLADVCSSGCKMLTARGTSFQAYIDDAGDLVWADGRGGVWHRDSLQRDQQATSHNGVCQETNVMVSEAVWNKSTRGGAFKDINTKMSANIFEWGHQERTFYKKTGWAQGIAQDFRFARLSLTVIVINLVCVGAEINDNHDAPSLISRAGWAVCNNLFFVFFLAELIIRYSSFESKYEFLKNNWCKLDIVLAGMALLETWAIPMTFLISGRGSLGLLRLLQFFRLTRFVHLMRALPELVTMVKVIRLSARAVLSSLLTAAVLTYVFGIVIFTSLKDETHPDLRVRFHSLPRCMWTLLLAGTLAHDTGFILTLLVDVSSGRTLIALSIFLAFIVLSAMTVWSVFVGAFCHVVACVAQSDHDDAAIKLIRDGILVELHGCDGGANAMVSRAEFEHAIGKPRSVSVLQSLGIDADYLKDLLPFLFQAEGSELPMQCIVDTCLMCRRDLSSMVKHGHIDQSYNHWHTEREFRKMQESIVNRLRDLPASRSQIGDRTRAIPEKNDIARL